MPRTDPARWLARLHALERAPDDATWLAEADATERVLAHEGLPLPAPLRARREVLRARARAADAADLDDTDWTVWRFAGEVVFRHPGARLTVDASVARLVVRDVEAALIACNGPIDDARVDVPTGRGLRTGRLRKGPIRVELRGTRLTVSGPAVLIAHRAPARLAPSPPPIDVEW